MKLGLTLVLIFCCLNFVFSQSEKGKLIISNLTGDFYVFTTYNSYKGTLFPANGMYLNTNAGVVMFDTPWDTTQFQPLLDSIRKRHQKDVVLCIATHSHADRTGGLQFLAGRNVKTFTSEMTDQICKSKNEKRAQFHFKSDTTFRVGQYSFQTFYGGPGHTPDNIVIMFPEQKIIYGGCLIKSTEATDLGNLADANVEAWPGTIDRIKKRFGEPAYVIPGHQGWSNKNSLDHTLMLLKSRKR